MATAGTNELKDEINRMAAEMHAVRAMLAHILSRLMSVGDPDIAAAIKRGLEDAERALEERRADKALTPSSFATALSAVAAVKAATLRSGKLVEGAKEEPGAFHAESNDQWPEDDY